MHYLKTVFGRLAYQKHGHGKNIYLLFHGFGQNSNALKPFLELRKPDECFILIDLFYHGQSSWKSISNRLTKETWKTIMEQLMEAENISIFGLIGYSMGGKFSLITYELFPSRISSLTLIAPDGIGTGFWYSMGSFPAFLNPLFKRVVINPKRFFLLVNKLHDMGLVGKSLVKFVESRFQSKTVRAQTYFTWKVFHPLKPDLKKIQSSLNQNPIPIYLFTGKFDKMVSTENLKSFSENVNNLKKIELHCGHNDLIDNAAKYLQKNFPKNAN